MQRTTLPPKPREVKSSYLILPRSSPHTHSIYFGVPTGAPDAFGLGYEELDEKGRGVPGTFKDIEPFDHLSVTVCLPLAAGNKPVTERWELVNVAGEDHNFHIHQTRFRVLPANAPAGDASGVMDNVPVPHGGPGCDGSIASFRRGMGGCAHSRRNTLR